MSLLRVSISKRIRDVVWQDLGFRFTAAYKFYASSRIFLEKFRFYLDSV